MRMISRRTMNGHVDQSCLLDCLGQMFFADWLARRRSIELADTVADERARRTAYDLWAALEKIGPAEEALLWKRRVRTVHLENGFGAADLRRERWGGAA